MPAEVLDERKCSPRCSIHSTPSPSRSSTDYEDVERVLPRSRQNLIDSLLPGGQRLVQQQLDPLLCLLILRRYVLDHGIIGQEGGSRSDAKQGGAALEEVPDAEGYHAGLGNSSHAVVSTSDTS